MSFDALTTGTGRDKRYPSLWIYYQIFCLFVEDTGSPDDEPLFIILKHFVNEKNSQIVALLFCKSLPCEGKKSVYCETSVLYLQKVR